MTSHEENGGTHNDRVGFFPLIARRNERRRIVQGVTLVEFSREYLKL